MLFPFSSSDPLFSFFQVPPGVPPAAHRADPLEAHLEVLLGALQAARLVVLLVATPLLHRHIAALILITAIWIAVMITMAETVVMVIMMIDFVVIVIAAVPRTEVIATATAPALKTETHRPLLTVTSADERTAVLAHPVGMVEGFTTLADRASPSPLAEEPRLVFSRSCCFLLR